jgi:uncharacterized protein
VDLTGRHIDTSAVAVLLERIIARWRPLQIWLFGSRARGEGRVASDWDLLVVVPDSAAESDFDPLVAWRLRKESGVRADVILARERDFADDRTTPNTIAYEVSLRGVLLHER